jgi:methionyl-tRNA synthetase
MPEPKPTFYLTTPIYYVNARPHIGHAYTTIVADVVARRHRLLGDDTFFLTGTDEHGQKIERAAAAAHVPPQQYADEVSASFCGLWARMGITNDAFIRTTDPAHARGVQRLFADLYERGYIELRTYTGQYCVSEEMFVEGPPGTIGPDGRPTETVSEENFFFKLSEFQRPLLDLIESETLKITPESRKNEVLSFLRGNAAGDGGERTAAGTSYVPGALKDLSISRSSFTWGIPVPEPAASEAKEKHVIYVWLDALANYMTAIGYGSDAAEDVARFERYWPADLHLVGKEIIRFHCVYWPAFLMAAGLPLPKQIVAHGWLLFEDSKMSKSRGNIVRTETILDAFGPLCPPTPTPQDTVILSAAHSAETKDPDEAGVATSASAVPQSEAALPTAATKAQQDLFASDILRYFLLREIPFGQDGSFSFDALIQRYNSDLANGYGNLVSRTLNMIHKYFDGVIPSPSDADRSRFESVVVGVTRHDSNPPNRFDFSDLLEAIWGMLASTDGYITRLAPWKLAADPSKRQELADVLYNSAEFIRVYTALSHPYLPYATAAVWRQLGLGDIEAAADRGELTNLQWGGLQPGTKLGPLSPIFPRADKGLAQIMANMESAPKPAAQDSPFPEEDFSDITPKSVESVSSVLSPSPEAASSHPAAGPRTATLAIDNPGATVAGSHALTTGPDGTPSHAQAQASGVFANDSATPRIAIDDFVKIDLRVAKIIVAERIPKADKLLRLEVDLGYETRQILSGIAQWYTPEELIGRRIVIIANLAPRKMRGLESHGMLLAASDPADENAKPSLTTFADDVPLGSRVR